MIKAAFFDVDGTLFSHSMKKFPERTLGALRLLKKNGIKIFLSTGRSFMEAQNLPWEGIVFDGAVTLNGQVCNDEKGTVIYGNPVTGADYEFLISAFVNKEMPLIIVEANRMYINFIDEAVERAQTFISIPAPEIGTYEGADVYQFIAYVTREEEDAFLQKIPNCKLARWYEGGVDIIPKNSGKMIGIKKMLEYHGLDREEIIAFGDGDNDADMVEYAGIGVAMGNAIEMTKEAADYVTDHIDEDGIWNALKHFQLI
jgi:Cof subfamily protein (haloacid dehalogenase superfamily)